CPVPAAGQRPAHERRAGGGRGGIRAGPAPGTGVRPLGPAADRRRGHRAGAPGDHPRRPGGGGEGAVSGHRRDHGGRPRQRCPAAPAAPDNRAQPGRGRAHHRAEGPRAGGARLPPGGAVREERASRREPATQRLLAAYYDGHPTIHIPQIIGELSSRRVVTSELSDGARFAELAGWPQEERDLAAETIYRFVFRSLYEAHAFNGDPHPGNYLFHGGGRVTFLDFGLVKHFTLAELQPLMQMARSLCVDNQPEAFRRSLEDAGFLRPHAPLSTETIVDHLGV